MVWVIAITVLLGVTDGMGEEPGERLRVTLEDVDSLRLAFTLPQLLDHLQLRLAGLDRRLLAERSWRTIRAFYGFEAAKREITLLTEVRDNLRALYRLDQRQAAAALAEDRRAMEAQNALLLREIELLRKVEECRSFLLDVLEFCLVELDDERPEADTATGSISARK
jgi:hypothetical protein